MAFSVSKSFLSVLIKQHCVLLSLHKLTMNIKIKKKNLKELKINDDE